MASIIPGYEYDIFISYRQKDNKYDGWVTEFVDNLKGELEATFKEDISIYFDENPHDGLLETHDVDASLKDKLKCLVFIPIISRTYCDPRSFAWEHEFKTFVAQASQDQFGLKVRLPNGNVANRVLPIRIHDLDNEDIKLCESVTGGFLRGVELIYKSPGVNRPLRSKEDSPNDNLNKTFYRDQINKVALAIREIISGMKKEPVGYINMQEKVISTQNEPVIQEKSIIVLPFENMSSDPDQEYFSDGLTEEIITDLSHIHDLLVISRSSAMTFKGSNKKVKDIADEVNVKYVLEGSVRKANNNLRITAQLIDGTNDSHIWAEKYTGTLEDVFDIQEKVSRSIVDALKIKISPEEKQKIKERPIDNVFAYDCYLRAYREIMSWTKERTEIGLQLLQKGIDISGENAVIYAGMALAHFQYGNLGIDQEEHIRKSEEFVKKALDIDPELAEAHFVYANIFMVFYGNPREAVSHYHRANSNRPDNPEIMVWLAWGYHLVGKTDAAIALSERCRIIDPLNPLYDKPYTGINNFMKGQFALALDPLQEMYRLSPEAGMWQLWKVMALMYNDLPDETYNFLCETAKEPAQESIDSLLNFLKYALKGDKDKMSSLLTPDVVKALQMDCQYSWHMAAFYSYIGEKDKSLEWLENAVNRGFINYPFLNEYDKLLNNVREEEQFKKLMKRVKHEWENFEV
jgi:TolB-like protein/tetratricopeptide (TPR) repeat protein